MRILERTRALGNAFASAEPEEKKLLLDTWIDGLLVVVEPVPDMPRANCKTAIVDLSTAHATCDRTSGSSSVSDANNSSTSSAEPTLPKTTAALRTSPRRVARFIGAMTRRHRCAA